ncbi:MAG: hypothetical protein JW912_06235 [Sedimentisphaerales bacterium]|nr:hypothetical protein [Sedimentisphaerales bacterium]
MEMQGLKRSSQSNRSGYAILMLLVVVAIGLIIYWMDINALFGNLPKSVDPKSSHEVLPWEKKDSLLSRGQEANTDLSEGQPVIDRDIFIEASVEQSNTTGDFIVTISPDGKVAGSWYADYNKGTNPRMNYVMNAKFKGNVDPGAVFFDENGEDPTKLFFIAKGEIAILASNFDGGGIQNSNQQIWVTGWLDPDYKAEGEMTLITGRNSYQTFNWKSTPKSNKALKGLL